MPEHQLDLSRGDLEGLIGRSCVARLWQLPSLLALQRRSGAPSQCTDPEPQVQRSTQRSGAPSEPAVSEVSEVSEVTDREDPEPQAQRRVQRSDPFECTDAPAMPLAIPPAIPPANPPAAPKPAWRVEVFVRRYSRGTRPLMSFHRDACAVTVSYSSSDASAVRVPLSPTLADLTDPC